MASPATPEFSFPNWTQSRNDSSAATKNSPLTEEVRKHVADVYIALACTLIAAAMGVTLHLMTNCGGLLSGLGSFGAVIALSSGAYASNFTARMGLLLGIGLLQGMTIGELVAVALSINPAIVLLAAAGTAVVFACFAAAALVAKRRTYLYLGGVLGSVTSIMCLMSLLNMFMRSPMLYELQLFGGLVAFCGFVVFDTQLMIEKAVGGSRDVALHAMELFVDFVSIFVRILIIMIRNAEKNQRRDSRRNSGSAHGSSSSSRKSEMSAFATTTRR
ncbi:inhibitor of apoptosis-promoting Bax1-domain-containing protein [Tribonema minus]|uniref:Inhibitor of apoptosis-promoting Bax1-domain-containing protein n=1 Tax=Tribonema minus TaxID=303371 RepID=A0A835ZGD5_9STRA|nr:inhibitor of apoptosis-promoting Bax1-domain-containing protein [Tribonema minus]